MIIESKNINEITLANLKNGEITLNELNEIYNKMGLVFIGSQGKFTRIKKETKN